MLLLDSGSKVSWSQRRTFFPREMLANSLTLPQKGERTSLFRAKVRSCCLVSGQKFSHVGSGCELASTAHLASPDTLQCTAQGRCPGHRDNLFNSCFCQDAWLFSCLTYQPPTRQHALFPMLLSTKTPRKFAISDLKISYELISEIV